MTATDNPRSEVLLAELDLHKTEFAALRNEILHLIGADRQSLNLTLVAIGASLGLAPFILNQNSLVILLLLPFVFHIILWDMLSTVRSISHISNYLTEKLIPRVNAILDELGSHRDGAVALGWEVHISTLPITKLGILLGSLTPTRYWMPILTIAALMIAYSVVVNSSHYSPSSGEVGLLMLNLVLLIYAGLQNTMIARSSMLQAQKLKAVNEVNSRRTDILQKEIAQSKKRKK